MEKKELKGKIFEIKKFIRKKVQSKKFYFRVDMIFVPLQILYENGLENSDSFVALYPLLNLTQLMILLKYFILSTTTDFFMEKL